MGEDKAYMKAFGLGRLYIPYDGKQTMEYRVGRHTDSILSFLDNLDLVYEERGVLVEGVPGMKELEEKGVGSFLSPVK